MDNNIVRNKDPIQLQQMIIFLRAELAKYKNEVNTLRDSDYYSLVLRLERENVQLIKQKKKLSMELLKQKRDYDRKIKAYFDDIQVREIQKKKQLSSIKSLLKELEELRVENKLIQGNLRIIKEKLLSMNSNTVQLIKQKKKLSMELLKQKRDYDRKIKAYFDDIQVREIQKKKQLSSIESLLKELEELRVENKLIKENLRSTKEKLLSMNSDTSFRNTVDFFGDKFTGFTRDINLQMKTIIEAIEKSRLVQANLDNLNKQLSKELEKKNNEIEKLSEELADVKKHNFSLNGKVMLNPEVLTHLDFQVNKVLAQSMDFEKQLNHKFRLLDDLDLKLNELTIEINSDKTV